MEPAGSQAEREGPGPGCNCRVKEGTPGAWTLRKVPVGLVVPTRLSEHGPPGRIMPSSHPPAPGSWLPQAPNSLDPGHALLDGPSSWPLWAALCLVD